VAGDVGGEVEHVLLVLAGPRQLREIPGVDDDVAGRAGHLALARPLQRLAGILGDVEQPRPGRRVDLLHALAVGLRADPSGSLEELDRTLTVLEQKIFAALLTASDEEMLIALREQADRELAPYRGRMQAVQIKQVQQQFLQKKLLEAHNLPRLSLFYMSLG